MTLAELFADPSLLDQCRTYKTTWQDVLDGYSLAPIIVSEPLCEQRTFFPSIYGIHDSDEGVIYIGKSSSPIDRLLSHVGRDRHQSTTAAGDYVVENLPASLRWTITIFDLPLYAEMIVINRYQPYFNSSITDSSWQRKQLVHQRKRRDSSALYLAV